ncbi:CNVH-domain-containing protein [Favolaschia claudopus]|uniref:CNVH-domain-containing protein n=1 Tax=Favolaschia claudopus TaxID=2862362 RepID=A0AAW0CZN9_9AGAR
MSFTVYTGGRSITVDTNESNFDVDKYCGEGNGYNNGYNNGYPGTMNDIFGGSSPGQRITTSASALFLEGTTLCGFCLGSDQKLHYSQIDLNNFYGNQNGSFVSGDRNFGYTAQNITLSTQNERGKVMLRAQLRGYNYGYNQAEVNLAVCIVNQGGQFGFVHNDGFWGADGWVAQLLEGLPYVGFVTAIIRKISGDEDRFRRAMIHASGSTAVAVLTSVGAYLGGPIGAALVAGVSTPLKMMLEQWAGSNLIGDPVLRQEFEEATLGKYIIETVTSMLAAGTSSQLARFFQQQAEAAIEALTYPILQAFAQWGVQKLSSTVNKQFIKKIIDGLVNGTVPYEWRNGIIGPSQLQGNNNQWNNQSNNNNQYGSDRDGHNSNNWTSDGRWIGNPAGAMTETLPGYPNMPYIPYNPPPQQPNWNGW